MYSTCIHCNAKLGANEVIEPFPVGRRLAFDAAKGRLWVVCPKCHRWNLTPLEERWEAIEECERQFRGTRLRASTDNIGLAKLSEGLELVRIGSPKRPEMAAWRYARAIQQRWRTVGLPLTAGLVGLTGLGLFGPGAAGQIGTLGVVGFVFWQSRFQGLGTQVALADGRVVCLSRPTSNGASLAPDDDHGWAIRFEAEGESMFARGAAGERVLRSALAITNYDGASGRRLTSALALLEQAGSADAYIRRLARVAPTAGATGFLWYPREIKLALEMALQEETERIAAEGELAALAMEWQLAEEIAHIADGLCLPPEVLTRLRELNEVRRP